MHKKTRKTLRVSYERRFVTRQNRHDLSMPLCGQNSFRHNNSSLRQSNFRGLGHLFLNFVEEFFVFLEFSPLERSCF